MNLLGGLLSNSKGESAKNNDSPSIEENEKRDLPPKDASEEVNGEKKVEERGKEEYQRISSTQIKEIQKGQDAIRCAISKLGDSLDESIQRAIGKLGVSQDENLLEAVRDAIRKVGASLNENLLSEMRSKIEGAEEKEAIIDKLYDELLAARDKISGKLTDPYAKCIMRYSQTLDEVVESLKSKVAQLDSVSEEKKLQATMEALSWSQEKMEFLSRLILSELKDGFNLVKFMPEPGEPFDSKVCNCLGTKPMEREEQKGTIASVAQCGFRDMESGRIKIYPNVFVYK